VVRVDGLQTQTKSMLEVLILTAARSGEVRMMEWSELDLEKGVWTLPAQRMKAKITQRVPLSPYLVDLFDEVKANANFCKNVSCSPINKKHTRL
jgi:integrase